MGDYCTTWPPTQKQCDMERWFRVRLCKHRANPFAINICTFLQFSLSILKDPASDHLHQKAWEDNMFSWLHVPIDINIYYIYIYWYHPLMFWYHGVIVFLMMCGTCKAHSKLQLCQLGMKMMKRAPRSTWRCTSFGRVTQEDLHQKTWK